MCDPVSLTIGSAAVLGAGTSAIQGSKARKAQRKAIASNEAIAAQQAEQAQRDAQRAEQQFNRQNQRQPDLPSILRSNRQRTGSGVGSTFLTGPNGIHASLLPLGGTSLLGQ